MTSSSCSLLHLRDHFLGRTVEHARDPRLRGQHLYHDAPVFAAFGQVCQVKGHGLLVITEYTRRGVCALLP